MASVQRLQFVAFIDAPPARVCESMIGTATSRGRTSAFVEGSRFGGSRAQGRRIRFLAPPGDGMVAEIVDNRPNEFISIGRLGRVANGVEDTGHHAVRARVPGRTRCGDVR